MAGAHCSAAPPVLPGRSSKKGSRANAEEITEKAEQSPAFCCKTAAADSLTLSGAGSGKRPWEPGNTGIRLLRPGPLRGAPQKASTFQPKPVKARAIPADKLNVRKIF